MDRNYYVYILTNQLHSVLYVGMTNDLKRRIFEHKNGIIEGFTKKFQIKHLIYYETTNDVRSAIEREKQLKHWSREKKEGLIGKANKRWEDLSDDLFPLEDLSSLRLSSR